MLPPHIRPKSHLFSETIEINPNKTLKVPVLKQKEMTGYRPKTKNHQFRAIQS